jgi:hypothetical protein
MGEADHHPHHGRHERDAGHEVLEGRVGRRRHRRECQHREAQCGHDSHVGSASLVGDGKDLGQIPVLESAEPRAELAVVLTIASEYAVRELT